MSRTSKALGIVVLVLVSTLAFAAKKQKPGTIPDQNDMKSGGPFLLNTADGPVLQFPVFHLHAGGRCYGYLQVSENAIRYVVTSGDAEHAFLYSHAEVRARKYHDLVALELPRGRYNMMPINRHMLENRNIFTTRANARDPERVIFTIENFRAALYPFQSLVTSSTPANTPPPPNQQPTAETKPADLSTDTNITTPK